VKQFARRFIIWALAKALRFPAEREALGVPWLLPFRKRHSWHRVVGEARQDSYREPYASLQKKLLESKASRLSNRAST